MSESAVNSMNLAQRLLAVLIIAIPGILAGYGWTLMREAVFINFAGEAFPLLSFIGGLLLFLLCTAFIAGYFIHRDKKKKR